jgi:hypothetical protein
MVSVPTAIIHCNKPDDVFWDIFWKQLPLWVLMFSREHKWDNLNKMLEMLYK